MLLPEDFLSQGDASAPGQTVQSFSLSLAPGKPLKRARADPLVVHSRCTGFTPHDSTQAGRFPSPLCRRRALGMTRGLHFC